MPVWKLNGATPVCAADVFVAPGAQVVGKVTLGQGVSVWFNAVVRADNEPMHIGANTNIQDAAVLHSDPGYPLTIGQNVTVGHQATLHGCSVGDGALIGIGAVVLNGAEIGRNCLVAAGAVVTEGKVFPDNSLIVGAPAQLKRVLTEEAIHGLHANAAHYVRNAVRYADHLEAADGGQTAE
ncbi:gamma carbonic anhydrase family protein [Lampropedia puyangensis]|uniref:Gamma carbonic anhydrase family protein n=1 Tax=Lampropedia puyangensis TaxID=1330072 RepID=A0A4S8F606_9BURK|nr:gamma carbonic anhydrase family protein [Lampropedia puyangensis]THU02025.1 gamma carbonic anhydrase family protein [Lampropedia puyangensis]